jgi:hypothetical protein
MDPDVGDLEQGDVLVEGSQISEVRSRIEATDVGEEIDASAVSSFRDSSTPTATCGKP